MRPQKQYDQAASLPALRPMSAVRNGVRARGPGAAERRRVRVARPWSRLRATTA
jgi:hypothetical protein